ncbi:VOC family protein [Paenibacillus thailandensis]|uniref:VOC family protein n=1 Tax=Paenibacillus thailandensis TaxID=393250 RepID=A0ABW5QVN1_9BACL
MKITELQLKTGKLEEMKQFYGGTLGFPLEARSSNAFTAVAGATRLTFIREEGDAAPNYHFAMNIPENKIEEAKAWLLDRSCPVLEAKPIDFLHIGAEDDIAFFEGTDAHAFYFEDPAGNLVEFIARHRMNNGSSEPFGSSSVLNVSEIGFPLRNTVPEAMDYLRSRIDVTPYVGDGKSFQMLGDDHGMFILGNTEIGWYPTRRVPEIHPIRMTVLADCSGEFQLGGYPYVIRTVAETSSPEGEEAIRP